MLKELYIEGYRGIKKAEVKDLAQINIFIGKNNSGKSSIVEAIYLLSSAFAKSDPLERNKMEYLLSKRGNGVKDLFWYNYQIENPIYTSVKLDSNDKIDIVLHQWYQTPLVKVENIKQELTPKEVDFNGYLLDLINNTFINNLTKTVIYTYPSNPSPLDLLKKSFHEFDKILEFMKNLMLIDFGTIRDLKLFEKNIWPKIVKKRLDRLITRILAEGYNIKAEGLTYIPTGSEYDLYVELEKTAIRVNDLGDGSRYSIYLLALASLSQNSALLIEEPENHQHPFGLYRTILTLLDLIKQNNTQLFITTHSMEFIKLLRKANKKYEIDTAIFYLDRENDGSVIARRLLLNDIRMLEKIGIDARFLYLI